MGRKNYRMPCLWVSFVVFERLFNCIRFQTGIKPGILAHRNGNSRKKWEGAQRVECRTQGPWWGREDANNFYECCSMSMKVKVAQSFRLFATPWTGARQAPLSLAILQVLIRFPKELALSVSERKTSQAVLFSQTIHITLCLWLSTEKTQSCFHLFLHILASDFWIDELSLLLSKVKLTNDDPHIFLVLKY